MYMQQLYPNNDSRIDSSSVEKEEGSINRMLNEVGESVQTEVVRSNDSLAQKGNPILEMDELEGSLESD